jgi:hypothetical protein
MWQQSRLKGGINTVNFLLNRCRGDHLGSVAVVVSWAGIEDQGQGAVVHRVPRYCTVRKAAFLVLFFPRLLPKIELYKLSSLPLQLSITILLQQKSKRSQNGYFSYIAIIFVNIFAKIQVHIISMSFLVNVKDCFRNCLVKVSIFTNVFVISTKINIVFSRKNNTKIIVSSLHTLADQLVELLLLEEGMVVAKHWNLHMGVATNHQLWRKRSDLWRLAVLNDYEYFTVLSNLHGTRGLEGIFT